MRLESTKPAALLLPLACIAYAWLAETRARRSPVHRALLLRLLRHVNQQKSLSPPATLTEDASSPSSIQLDLLKHTRFTSPTRIPAALSRPSQRTAVSVASPLSSLHWQQFHCKTQRATECCTRYGLDFSSSANSCSGVVRVHGGPWRRVNAEDCEKTQSFSPPGGS